MVRNLCVELLKFCLFLSLANAKVLQSVGKLPGSPLLIRTLAETICPNIDFMFANEESAGACPENFNNVDSVSSLRSEVKVRCRWSAATLQLEAAPSSWWQVAVLVPDHEEQAAMSYSLIWPGSTHSSLDVPSPRANYSLYATVLREGRATFWRRQEPVLAWNHLPDHKDYHVQMQFVNYTRSEADESITGIMTWNHTGDADACFTFTNYCKKLMSMDVREQRAVVPGLPLDQSCRFEVAGLHGTTTLHYQTPHRDLLLGNDANTKDVSKNATLQVPKIVFIEGVERGGGGWAVRVAWAPPTVAPDFYTLVLTADNEHTLNLTGNATEATIKDVTGEGVYNVSLYAYMGTLRAHTFRRAVFIGSASWGWVGAVGGTWAVVALCLLGLALCWLRLRSRRLADEKPKGQDRKPLEEFLLKLESECDDQWEMKSERLKLLEVIGEGAFGSVRRAVLAPEGKEVAVKMLQEFPSTEELRAFRLEMEVMKSVGAHGHVVSLLGCCSGARPMIVQEYCAKGDLLQFLRGFWDVMLSKRNAKYYNNNNIGREYRNDLFKGKPQRAHSRLVVNKMYERGLCDTPELTALDLLSFCRQIAMGMEFLAGNRLVHRDLAARNVLVTRDRTLKIADFGLTRDVYEENQYKQKGNGKMPLKWMAPESLARKIYTTQSDVWSFGITVWEVITLGASPYPEVPAARLPRLLLAGYRMPRPPNCTKQLYEVMLSCWRASPRARPSFAALHRQLDELLQCACAGDYLSLELLDASPPPPPPPSTLRLAYLSMIMRGRAWTTRNKTYERPLEAPPRGNHNHYSTPPATPPQAPA